MRTRAVLTILGLVAAACCVAPAEAGTLTGRVVAGRGVVQPVPLSVAVDDWACGDKGAIPDPRLVVGSGGEITDVVVRLVDVAGAPAYPDRGPALIDQKGCVFVPHVTVIAPGQELVARNSDPVLHNFRTITKSNRTVNKAQVKGKQDTFRFDSAEILSVECDVHYWMSAVIVVADSAFVAVTGKDGSYRIDGVPPAAYTVEFWHQQLGSRRAMVDVTAEGGRLDLSWDAAP